ncbi:hypothetical protein [Actinotignum schaalii]|uniref:hypothetical protein n=1 Tax=Actinotignum schaalii TaxID=59505 RepID=UPI0003F6A3B3|nr:hypothetical protein [Actinotignum schaalii]AIE82826.1 hypothetical protein FB03_05660 [Actinotignum schaalii]WQN44949.1 hypothetical protein U4A90_08145 [Actinotignum schaalii]
MIPSPLLCWPGAVPGEGEAAGVAAFYTNPYVEQRELEAGRGFVDLSHWQVLRGRSGAWPSDCLGVHNEPPGAYHAREVLECDAEGRILNALLRCPAGAGLGAGENSDAGEREDIFLSAPGGPDFGMYPANYIAIGTTTQGAARLRAAMHNQPGLSATFWEDWWPGSDMVILLAEDIEVLARAGQAAGMSPVGLFAWTACRVAARRPDPFRAARAGAGLRDIYGPGLAGLREIGGAGRSPACLYLEGPDEADLPEPGTPVHADRVEAPALGYVTSAVRHWEEGPLALALLDREAAGYDAVGATLGELGLGLGQESTALGAVRVAEFRCGVESIPLPTHAPVAVTIRESGEKSVVGRD